MLAGETSATRGRFDWMLILTGSLPNGALSSLMVYVPISLSVISSVVVCEMITRRVSLSVTNTVTFGTDTFA